VLTPVAEVGYWRVKIAWPRKTPRYFGTFQSQAEAQNWIEHRWFITQPQEPGADDPEPDDDLC
jgi:hypothetical protein